MTVLEYIRGAVGLLTAIVAAYALLSISYSWCQLLVALAVRIFSKKASDLSVPVTRFCLLVPAHDEELVITETLESIRQLRYPSEMVTVVVIADNCTDQTSAIASSFGNVTVLERQNPDERGKGYALNWALSQLAPCDSVDNFVIIDADTVIDPLFLLNMDRRRAAGSSPYFVAQGRYDVLNPADSWRTALMAGALSLVHVVRPSAKEALGLSAGLKGNGMSFDRYVLMSLPWRGDSLTEDLEYTLDLLEQLKTRVVFVPDARVAAQMPTSSSSAASQRSRWENGRSVIIKRRLQPLLSKGLSTFNMLYLDAAFDLLLPPLAQIGIALCVWTVMICILGAVGGSWKYEADMAIAAAAALALYVLIGFFVGGAPKKAYTALFHAPIYMMWKVLLSLNRSGGGQTEWIRTARERAEPVTEDIEDSGRAAKVNH